MGCIIAEHGVPHEEHLSLTLIMPRLVFIGQLVMTGVLSITIMVAAEVGQERPLSSNPFDAYTDILPGQPSSALAPHGFTCVQRYGRRYNNDLAAVDMLCTLEIETGAVYHIEVTQSDGVIHSINFTLRDEVLCLGDLVVLLDLKDIRPIPHKSVTFTWRGFVGTASLVNWQWQVFTAPHIRRVTLTDVPANKP